MDARELFDGHPETLKIYDAVADAIASIGPAEETVGRSQVAFRRRRAFIAHPASRVWMHHIELRGPAEVNDEVRAWLAAAYEHAG